MNDKKTKQKKINKYKIQNNIRNDKQRLKIKF